MTVFRSKQYLIVCLALADYGWASAEDHALATSEASISLTVVANKIEENINDVPQAITVIDQLDLEDKGIQSARDVIREVPNMQIGNNGGHRISFRGLSPSVFTNNNPVVIYIDGVPTTDIYASEVSLANAERIEVLRGPQGTLYGKDAIGAVINVVTKAPSEEWTGHLNAEVGSHDRRFATLSTSGPLVGETVSAGINGQIESEEGWINNTYQGTTKDANTKDAKKVGGYVLFKPTEKLTAKLNVAHETRDDGWWDGYGQPGGTDFADFNREDATNTQYDVDQREETEMNSQSLSVGFAGQSFDIQSTTTHKVFELDGVYDADYGVDPAFAGLTQFNHAKTDGLSQELRIASNNATGFRWVTGIYLDNEERTQAPYGQEFPSFYDSTGDGVAEAFAGNFRMNAESETNSQTRALFGQLMLPITDRTELTLGARYQRIKKDIDLQMYYLPVGQQGDAYYLYKDERSWNAFLPKLAIRHTLSDQWTAYASYSKGYMPGGFNYFATSGDTYENSFSPQTSNNQEIGIKGQIDDVSISANVFYMDIKDIHVYKAVGTTYLTENAEKATSKGAELEATWFATDTLHISGALGYTDAKYDKYDNGLVRFDGKRVTETPHYTAKIGVAYEGQNNVYARLDLYAQGALYYYDDAQKKLVKRDPYSTADIRGGYRLGNWNIYGFVNNVTDEKYMTGYMSSSLVSLATFGSPRTVGVGTHYSF